MLINFTLRNWKSFKDTVEFTTRATKEKRHNETLSRIKKYSLRILPISVIFGGNASGKSNFVEALVFSKEFITNPKDTYNSDEPIGHTPFKLDEKSINEETYFSFVILVDKDIYEYSFSLLNNIVNTEELNRYTSTKSICIYKRSGKNVTLGEIGKNKKNQTTYLDYVKASLPDKLLFLTHAVRQNLDELAPIYNWFKYNLEFIHPDSIYKKRGKFGNQKDQFAQAVNDILRRLETGIDHLEWADADQATKQTVINSIKAIDQSAPQILPPPLKQFLTSDPTKQKLRELVSIHKSSTGKEIRFRFDEESDGTKRLIELAPAFYQLANPDQKVVYIIDEFDRSLHPNLSHNLIKYFLDGCDANNRSQLIFTTHDLFLIDLDLLRTDEIWMTEKNKDGSTNIIPLSKFEEISKDKHLINSYRDGRFSYIPSYTLLNPKLLSKQ